MFIWLIYLFLPMLLSYGLYPLILSIFAKSTKKISVNVAKTPSTLKNIYILMALHNEEKVIATKLESIIGNTYPLTNIFLVMGLDACTDHSETIIEGYRNKLPNLRVIHFNERSGKPAIINELFQYVATDALVFLTDANVFIDKNALTFLSQKFDDESVMLADALFRSPEQHAKKDAIFELQYNSFEQQLKHWESVLGGMLMGPSGGGYMIRATAFTPVPHNFLVDDFFIGLNCFRNGGKCILVNEAICYETVNGNIGKEFNRKRRISAGNFQNLFYFMQHQRLLSLKQWTCFFFHKILRWVNPLWICFHLLAYLFLTEASRKTAIFIIILIIANTILNMVLSKLHLHWKPVKSAYYFIAMNIGLLWGFFDYLKGIKSNVWQPTPRN